MKTLLRVLVVRKIFVLFLTIAMLAQQQPSYSQALPVQPVANFVVNRAVGQIITRVAASRGFAANDARIAATMVSAGNALTVVNTASTVAGVGLAVAGAPVWLTVAAGLGILGIGAAIVAGTSSISIAPTSNGNVLEIASTSSAPLTPPYSGPSAPVDPFARYVSDGYEIYRDDPCFPSQACYAFPPLPTGVDIPIKWRPYVSPDFGAIAIVFWSLEQFKAKWTPHGHPPGTWFDGYWYNPSNFSMAMWTTPPYWEVSANNKRLVGTLRLTFQDSTTAPDIVQDWNSTNAPLLFSPNIGPNRYPDLQTAYNTMSPTVASQKLSNDTLAKIVDKAWQNAASQPGYEGLPYSVTQPVTASDVAPWAMQNPMTVPNVADLLSPANNPGSNAVPISPSVQPSPATNSTPTDPTPTPTNNPNVNVVNTPNVNVINQVRVDLGPDPAIGSPTIENIPTAQMILQPLFDLFPSLRNYTVPGHGAECPKPSFNIFDKTIVMDSHCTLTESVRPTLYAVMAAVWVMIGLLIVLAA